MRVWVKICGITDIDAAVCAYQAGAEAIGFVFTESVRQVSPQQAAAISEQLPGPITRVAVFGRPSQMEVERVLADFPADRVQADYQTRPVLPSGVRFLPVFRDIADLPGLDRHLGEFTNQEMLFEGEVSGSGERVDWARAEEVARSTRLILAGGLDPDNVAAGVAAVRPYGVDVSTGVESAPGVKDPEKIIGFVESVRLAGRLLEAV